MQKRDRRPVNFDLDAILVDELEEWLTRQDPAPTKRAAMETALREFLAKRRKGKK